MPFASVLDAYCVATGYTNKDIAARCGISASALSRYRKGERTPEPESNVIGKLAGGIAEISNEVGIEGASSRATVKSALETSLIGSRTVGMSFSSRVDALMRLLEIRNITLARGLGVSPSYISRIRAGQRMPAERLRFAEVTARIAAQRCSERGMFVELMALIDSVNDVLDRSHLALNQESDLFEIINQWLLGNNIVQSDIAAIERLFEKFDSHYYLGELEVIAKLEPVEPGQLLPEPLARFYYQVEGMREAELLFFRTAIAHDAEVVYLSSDMPMLEMALDAEFVIDYRRAIATLVRNGCHIVVIHSAERSIRSTIKAMELWAPLYISGNVTPFFLKGVNNRLFCHVNNVCEACALAAEAVMGHQPDGRYYFTTKPDDLGYYKQKMEHILERTFTLLELFREENEDERRRYQELMEELESRESAREVCAGRYENLRIVLYPSECVIVTIKNDPTLHLVIRHPKLRYAISCMK